MEQEAVQSLPVSADAGTAPTFKRMVGAITDNLGNQEMYVIGTDGNLWRYQLSNTTWTNVGTPSGGVTIATFTYPTVIYSGVGYAYVLLFGSDGNLWHWSADPTIGWENLTGSAYFTNGSLVGAVSVRDGNVYVYYTGYTNNEVHLFLCNWAGGWSWTDLGVPPGAVNTLTGAGVAMVDDNSSPYAFVMELGGNLWCNFFTGSGWAWSSAEALPSGISVMTPVGGVNLNGIANTFYLDWQGGDHLWSNWDNGSQSFTWTDLGKPQGKAPYPINLFPNNMVTIEGSDGNAYVFLQGQDLNIWCWVGKSGSGTWQNAGTPGNMGTLNSSYAAATQGSTKPNLFVVDSNGKIWMASWNTTTNNWAWAAQPLN